ncbi:hypothetical protein EVAR_45984_1 [Eumeta japonica]|uniref:Uncharacterized protein n=1 Tax=Eumeta variegata TaxID=151549 RepID=A0A4C1X742_EUMVA|nr:hypothetical protein EVAR_45984_1 [Eumeta japonica]
MRERRRGGSVRSLVFGFSFQNSRGFDEFHMRLLFLGRGPDLPYGFLGFSPGPREFKGPTAKSRNDDTVSVKIPIPLLVLGFVSI